MTGKWYGAVAIFAAALKSAQAVCPSGYSEYGHSCYKRFTSASSWLDARDICADEGGWLVSISDERENEFVESISDSESTVWIGLGDRNVEGKLKWDHGEAITYTNWRSGQPDDFEKSEDCVELRGNDGTWNDATCTDTKDFVCEIPPSPSAKPTSVPTRTPAGGEGLKSTSTPTSPAVIKQLTGVKFEQCLADEFEYATSRYKYDNLYGRVRSFNLPNLRKCGVATPYP
jgi:hypothetical protein